MKIRSMTATFGKLDRARLELGPGLNLIAAPNEAGKSTWCAFWKTMLFGLDTRDRDRKGHLADKNRYQPWSGAPMEGELTLEWQGRDITIRRGPRGTIPFGSFSAVYTDTQQPVPGLTADSCGPLLTGVSREVFERSAFLSGEKLAVTAAPELEKRIAALISSGQEDVSFSQTEARLKQWLNRRKVNRSVGSIPRLESELEEVLSLQADLEAVCAHLAQLEQEQRELEGQCALLSGEQNIHRRLARRELNRRCAQAGQELARAQVQLAELEREGAKYGPIPSPERLRKAQGELQYLRVLDDEIRQGEQALSQAEDAYVQAQIHAQEERFPGMTAEEAVQQVDRQRQEDRQRRARAAGWKRRGWLSLSLTALLVVYFQFIFDSWGGWRPAAWWFTTALPLLSVALFLLGLFFLLRGRRLTADSQRVFSRYSVQSQQELDALLESYRTRCAAADAAALHAKTVRTALNDRKARRANSHADLLAFVHSFAPQVTDLFGCSAALSRALSLEHERTLARSRVEERRLRREDLLAQGGQDTDTLELLHAPEHTPEETDRLLADASSRLEQVRQEWERSRGRQAAMGDPAALAARRESLEEQLQRRTQEYEAISLAMSALQQANAQLQERFSPALNRQAGAYLSRLTGQRYRSLSLNREMEGAAARQEDILPHSALYLSRGTTDQLYLAVRLAVCSLCLPEKPPLILDDALACFDDERLEQALELLLELAREQQILLFSCHSRERSALAGREDCRLCAL